MNQGTFSDYHYGARQTATGDTVIGECWDVGSDPIHACGLNCQYWRPLTTSARFIGCRLSKT